MKLLLPLIITLIILLVPDLAFAQNLPNVNNEGIFTGKGLIPCGQNADTTCNTCHIVILANTVIKWLIGITFMIFAVMAVYSGIKLVISGGNSSAKEDAKEMFTNAFIGLFIILGAWLMIDTLLRFVLKGGESGNIQGYGPWSQVECVTEAKPGIVKRAIQEAEFVAVRDFGSGVSVQAPGSGGSCAVSTSGNCSVSNLSCFGAKASQASQVCNIESSGGNAGAISGTDLCKDNRSFSGGLFQINILAHGDKLNNCSPDFFTKNGSSPQGNCLQFKTSSGGVRYCQIRDCRVTNVEKYKSCMQQTLTAQSNIAIACRLFNARGGNFNDWITSARRCGVQ